MKSISAPYIAGDHKLDGNLTAPAWKQASFFDDFQYHKHIGTPLTARTEVRVFHNGKSLYVGVICHEPTGKFHEGSDENLFGSLDRIECFFGNMQPYPSCIQYAVAAGGMRYSGDGDADAWHSAVSTHETYWAAEIEVPFSKIHITDMTVRFNICRGRVEAAESQVWEDVGVDFMTLPRFGEICLNSYDDAARAKFNYYGHAPLNRDEYEKLNQELTVPSHVLRCGPWLYDPSYDAISVGWCNAGGCPSALEYRLKGDKQYNVALSHYEAGVWDKGQSFHKVRLSRLEPGAEYEYRVLNYLPDAKSYVCHPEKEPLSFTLPSPDAKECRFLIFSDIHGKRFYLENFLKKSKLIKKCDFIVNMGDMLTNSNGHIPIFEGYLDAETSFISRHPMFNLRGNHETRGILPTSYMELFGHQGGKSYFMFNFGELCIIGVDGAEDYLNEMTLPYLKEQNEWLRKIVKTPEFTNAKKRILLSHMPILEPGKYSEVIQTLLDGVFIGDKPLAKIDVMLSGHTHRASFTEPNHDTYYRYYLDGTEQRPCIPLPFPLVCNSGPGHQEPSFTALYVEYANGSLKVDIILPQDEKAMLSFNF